MGDIELLLAMLIAGFSILIFIVSVAAFIRIKVSKFLLVSIAFFLFFIKGILLIFEIISQSQLAFVIDLLIILFLYVAVVKK